jgi:hypothetical protein
LKGSNSRLLRKAIDESLTPEILDMSAVRPLTEEEQQELDQLLPVAAPKPTKTAKRKLKATQGGVKKVKDESGQAKPRRSRASAKDKKVLLLHAHAYSCYRNPRERRCRVGVADAMANATETPLDQLFALRHKFQKIFLGDAMRVDEFDKVDALMTELESFSMTLDLLKVCPCTLVSVLTCKDTKIGKVMKRISLMTVPNEPARLVERSKVLVERWHSLLPPSALVAPEPAAPVAPNVQSKETADAEKPSIQGTISYYSSH